MRDTAIIELFFERDREALRESETKYSHLLTHIAGNILASKENVEECVNDTWLKLWESIPPNQPESLKNYAARIVRNLAIDRYRRCLAQCRNGEVTSITDELSEIIADKRNDNAESDGVFNVYGEDDEYGRVATEYCLIDDFEENKYEMEWFVGDWIKLDEPVEILVK